MNRMLQWLNFLGVLALAGLCVVQWNVNRRLNLTTAELERTLITQDAKIDGQSKTIREQAADIEEFRERVRLSETALADAEKELRTLRTERDELKTSLAQWTAAVAQRDAVIKHAAGETQKLSEDRNDAVKKFNELAAKYNALLKN